MSKQQTEVWTDGGDADLSVPRSTKGLVAAVVVLLHVLGFLALIRALAPDFTNKVADTVLSTFTVTVVTPPPPSPAKAPEKSGAEAEIGKKAVPREKALPKPKADIARRREAAPKLAGRGDDTNAGARDQGSGTGAGGQGSGTGAGNGGDGTGGGAPAKLEKIAGDINSTRDFPGKTREQRKGTEVIVQMDVGTDGRASNCKVVTPSPDAEADRIVCKLAEERFRFKPRTDAAGNPLPGKYRWRQKWWQ
jgi:protein TonB